jgi:hypothetical protein
MYIARSAAILLIAAVSGGAASAQSLGDVARKEEARRKGVPTTKVYTNKDLGGRPGETPAATTPPPAATPAAPASTPATEEAKDKGPVKDQAYWAGRMKGLQGQLERDQNYADAMQTRINALTTDFVNRDDPAQRSVVERDRQKSIAELARLKKSIEDGKKAIAVLEEEARRAGAPPGWLR